jgi:hypothetical protein
MEPVVHVIAIAVTPETAEDAMKLRAALPLLAAEDPTLCDHLRRGRAGAHATPAPPSASASPDRLS